MKNENTIHIDVDVDATLDILHSLIRTCDELDRAILRDLQRRLQRMHTMYRHRQIARRRRNSRR